MNEELRENQEEEARDEDSFFDDDMSVRSDREVQILHQVGEVQPGPMANLEAAHVPDLQPDQEPEDEREDEQHGERGPGHRDGDDPGLHGGDDPPDPPGELPRNEVWTTPMGTRYHLSRRCPTLANSRTIRRSEWCQYCGRRERALVRPNVYIATAGGVAHVDRDCIMVGPRAPGMYPCCQVCPTR